MAKHFLIGMTICMTMLGCLSQNPSFTPVSEIDIPKYEDPLPPDKALPESPATENMLEEDLEPNAGEEEADELIPIESAETIEPAVEIPRIPLMTNEHVEKWMAYFTGRGRERFQRYISRGEVYRPRIEKILQENGMPLELYYLALIESGFANRARSSMGAVGIWQFVRGTGRRYDLHIQGRIDERQDPIRATQAASLYLRDLKNVFDSWFLAISAYNSGEMRVLQAIMSANTRDYWKLIEMKKLPRETRNYVPKFLAARIIGTNPAKYGFHTRPVRDPLFDNWLSVEVPSPVQLKQLAKSTGTSFAELDRNNPHLRGKNTPSQVRFYELWVDLETKTLIEAQKKSLSKLVVRTRQSKPIKDVDFHRVRRGESLYIIGQRYGVSVGALKRENGFSRSRIYIGQKIAIPKDNGSISYKKYRVRRGDNLSVISRKFGTSIRILKKINRLRRSRIYTGQILKVGYKKG